MEGVVRKCQECKEPLPEDAHGKRQYCEPCSLARRQKKNAGYMQEWNRRKREQVIAHYGGACACCGETHYEFLTIDHINGNGNAHRREVGANIAHWLVKNGFPPGFRLLCANCNFALGNYGICPHENGEHHAIDTTD